MLTPTRPAHGATRLSALRTAPRASGGKENEDSPTLHVDELRKAQHSDAGSVQHSRTQSCAWIAIGPWIHALAPHAQQQQPANAYRDVLLFVRRGVRFPLHAHGAAATRRACCSKRPPSLGRHLAPERVQAALSSAVRASSSGRRDGGARRVAIVPRTW